jgi:hypothetical protein
VVRRESMDGAAARNEANSSIADFTLWIVDRSAPSGFGRAVVQNEANSLGDLQRDDYAETKPIFGRLGISRTQLCCCS